MFLLEICNTLHLLPLNSICVNSLGLFGGANNPWTIAPYSLESSANRVIFELESKGVFR